METNLKVNLSNASLFKQISFPKIKTIIRISCPDHYCFAGSSSLRDVTMTLACAAAAEMKAMKSMKHHNSTAIVDNGGPQGVW